jgi:hypothetical protein
MHPSKANPQVEMSIILDEILDVLGPDHARRAEPIARDTVSRRMSSDDLEALGATRHLLDIKEFRERILPPLSSDEHQAFFLRYSERCILEDPQGEWADSRYEAGWALVGWFRGLWSDKTVPRQKPLEIKQMLGRLYTTGDTAVRTCLVTATLEHLFEDRRIAKYFEDWKKDPVLATAYAEGMLWSEKGGKSPLSE